MVARFDKDRKCEWGHVDVAHGLADIEEDIPYWRVVTSGSCHTTGRGADSVDRSESGDCVWRSPIRSKGLLWGGWSNMSKVDSDVCLVDVIKRYRRARAMRDKSHHKCWGR